MSWWKRSSCSPLTSPHLAGNRSRWLYKKCTLILTLAPRRWLLLPRKFCTTPTKPRHASVSSGFIESMKFSSCISFRMSGPSKIPALSFSILSPGNDRQMYLKHSPSLSRAFPSCLISPNFICRGGVLSCLWVQGVNLLCFCLPLWALFEAPNPF